MNITTERIVHAGLLSLLLTLNGRAQDYSVPVQSVTQLHSYIESAWTNSYLPKIMPPDMGPQQIDLGVIQYTDSFDTNLLSVMTCVTNTGICQFQMTAVETNSPTHQRLWLNATGGLISTWNILYARDDWITQTYGEMPSYYEAGSTDAVAWAAARSPERIAATLALLSTNDYPAYLASLTNSVGGTVDTNGQVISLLTLHSNEVAFVGISQGDPAKLSLHTPTNTVQIGVFGSFDLLGAEWSQLTTLPRTTDPILWNYYGINEFSAFALGDMRDSDGDGIADVVEELITKTDPSQADSDGDGLSDGAEWRQYATNPLAYSTSGSGLSDGWLVSTGLNPLNANVANQDPDYDTLSNAEEQQAGTDPLAFDNIVNVNPYDVAIQYRSQTIYHEKRGFLSFTERITPAEVPTIYQHFTSVGGYERSLTDCEECNCLDWPAYEADTSLRADVMAGVCGLLGDQVMYRDYSDDSQYKVLYSCTNNGQFHYVSDGQFYYEGDGDTWAFANNMNYRGPMETEMASISPTARSMIPSSWIAACNSGVVHETLSDPFTTAILTDLAWQRYDAMPDLSNAVAWGKSVHYTQSTTVTNSASPSAHHSVVASETNISLTRNAYRFFVPTVAGLVYRMYWAELAVDTNGNQSVETPRSIAFKGTGGTVTVENADFVLSAPEDLGSRVIHLVNVDSTRDWFFFDGETESQDITRGLVQRITRPGDTPSGSDAVWLDWYSPDLTNCQIRVKKLAPPRASINCLLLDAFTGEILLDTNQAERVWALEDAPWGLTPDSTASGICDVELTLEQGEHVLARDRMRIHFIPATPASGPVVYVDPSATHHQAPYNALGNRSANTLDAAVQYANGVTNANILVIGQNDPSLWPIESSSPQISRAMTIAGVAGRWADTNTFDYSGLPNIRNLLWGSLVRAADMTNSVDQFGIRMGGLQLDRGLSINSGGAGSFSNVSVAIEIGFSTITSNRANDFGGGLYFERCPNVSVHDSVFTDNLAEHDAGSSVVCDKGMGGAIAMITSGVTVADCSFENNKAMVTSGGQLPALGSAGGGGDIYSKSSTLRVLESTLVDSVAGVKLDPPENYEPDDFTGDGGSILVHGTSADSTLDIQRCTFYGTRSYGNGGALSISYDSSADARSYFVAGLQWPPMEFRPPNLNGGCVGQIIESKFLNCKGGWQGGAISVNGRTVSLMISNCLFELCEAGATHARDGKAGAVAVGGGLQWTDAPENNVSMYNCDIYKCFSSGNGGGLYTTIRGKLTLLGRILIDGCEAQDTFGSPRSEGMGGAVHVSAGGWLLVGSTEGLTIVNNKAATSGGGLSVKSGNVYLSGSIVIQTNEANGSAVVGYGNGGGLFATTSFHDDLSAGMVAASIWGHGLVQTTGISMNVSFNTAKRWGGGVYVGLSDPWYDEANVSASKVSLSGISILQNRANMEASGSSLLPAQVVFERVQGSILIPPFWSALGSVENSAIEGNPTTDIGIYMLDSVTVFTNGCSFNNLAEEIVFE